MKTALWAFAAVFGLLSLVTIAMNYLLVWQELRAKPGEKTPSMIPIVGGLLGAFAVQLHFMATNWPQARGWTWHVLLPPALDPGCYLLYFLIMPVIWKLRGNRQG